MITVSWTLMYPTIDDRNTTTTETINCSLEEYVARIHEEFDIKVFDQGYIDKDHYQFRGQLTFGMQPEITVDIKSI